MAEQTARSLRCADIEAEERISQTQIRRLEADQTEILPSIGYDFDVEIHPEQYIVQLPKPGNWTGLKPQR